MAEKNVTGLIESLIKATREQGSPNTYTPYELEAKYGGPTPRQVGTAWRYYFASIISQMEEYGYAVDYKDRTFCVAPLSPRNPADHKTYAKLRAEGSPIDRLPIELAFGRLTLFAWAYRGDLMRAFRETQTNLGASVYDGSGREIMGLYHDRSGGGEVTESVYWHHAGAGEITVAFEHAVGSEKESTPAEPILKLTALETLANAGRKALQLLRLVVPYDPKEVYIRTPAAAGKSRGEFLIAQAGKLDEHGVTTSERPERRVLPEQLSPLGTGPLPCGRFPEAGC